MTHPEQCLCAPPGITRAGYAALLEQRRAAHVEAWREGAGMVNAADTHSCTPSIHFGVAWTEDDLIKEYEERVKEAKEKNQ